MSEAVVAVDADVEGVVRISADPGLPTPHVVVIGSMHGDEHCGLHAIKRLRADAEKGKLAPGRGTLVLVHGNPHASRQHRRYGEGGVDLNRLFDWHFVDELPRERWTWEHERAFALKSIFEEADYMLDLHSAFATTPPFAIVNEVDGSLDLARRIGVGSASYGWFGGGFLGDRTSMGVLARRGRPAVAVECGRHDDPRAPEVAYEVARRFLGTLEVLDVPAPEQRLLELEMFAVLTKPSEGFRFHGEVHGLDRLREGQVLGSDGTIELKVDEDCHALLPNDTVPVGGDMVYLARAR